MERWKACSKIYNKYWNSSRIRNSWICRNSKYKNTNNLIFCKFVGTSLAFRMTWSRLSPNLRIWKSWTWKTTTSPVCPGTSRRCSDSSRILTWMATTWSRTNSWMWLKHYKRCLSCPPCTWICTRKSKLIWWWGPWLICSILMGCRLKERYSKRRKKRLNRRSLRISSQTGRFNNSHKTKSSK